MYCASHVLAMGNLIKYWVIIIMFFVCFILIFLVIVKNDFTMTDATFFGKSGSVTHFYVIEGHCFTIDL